VGLRVLLEIPVRESLDMEHALQRPDGYVKFVGNTMNCW
jgi:hypothetical protein